MDVLVVDDDSTTRIAIAEILKTAGYGVTVASSGEEALYKLRSSSLQIVICDRDMPDTNGLDVCRVIRRNVQRRYIYIVLLTSYNRPEDIVAGLQAGADDYVVKPFNPHELIWRVNTGRRIISSESCGVTIFALAKLAESRDLETGLHLERVRSYSQLLARELKGVPECEQEINQDFIRSIYETSPLHDIGKVAIPDSVLLKPGKLTEAEFEVMKTHTIHGGQTLAAAMAEFPNAEYLKMAHDIALHHHEWYDGQGYPHGLAGSEIPLCARIVALADVYDAMTSKRVYKDAASHDEATHLIEQRSGSQFDPVVVRAFTRLKDQFCEVNNRLADNGSTPVYSEVDSEGVLSTGCFPQNTPSLQSTPLTN